MENNTKPSHRSIRLSGYNYKSPGYYFVTVCCFSRMSLLGSIKDAAVILNDFGKIVEYTWNDLPNHIDNIELDYYVIMPNHFHGIIHIIEEVKTESGKSLAAVIRQFKTFSAKRINEKRGRQGTAIWQRNYYEHIIRNDDELYNIRKYIVENPLQKEIDEGIKKIVGTDI